MRMHSPRVIVCACATVAIVHTTSAKNTLFVLFIIVIYLLILAVKVVIPVGKKSVFDYKMQDSSQMVQI